MEEKFEEFWMSKPKRGGSNPRSQAFTKFSRLVSSGIDPDKIISAARIWARDEEERGKTGTEYVPMAVTWLNQQRFNDYEPEAITEHQRNCEAIANSKGWFWNGQRWEKRNENQVVS